MLLVQQQCSLMKLRSILAHAILAHVKQAYRWSIYSRAVHGRLQQQRCCVGINVQYKAKTAPNLRAMQARVQAAASSLTHTWPHQQQPIRQQGVTHPQLRQQTQHGAASHNLMDCWPLFTHKHTTSAVLCFAAQAGSGSDACYAPMAHMQSVSQQPPHVHVHTTTACTAGPKMSR
jgi:hypothetical protein